MPTSSNPFKHHFLRIIVIFIISVFCMIVAFLLVRIIQQEITINLLTKKIESVEQAQSNLSLNFSEELFADHLKFMEKHALEDKLQTVEKELEDMKFNSLQDEAENENISVIYDLYDSYQAKLSRNSSLGLYVSSNEKLDSWGSRLLSRQFSELLSEINEEIVTIDSSFKEYSDSLPPPVETSPAGTQSSSTVPAGLGFVKSELTTEKGTKHTVWYVKASLKDYKVKTLAATKDDCRDNCPSKTLAEFVRETNGFAGINGIYACPPDYLECKGKVNSFDFAFYDTNNKKWLNKKALSWTRTGLMTVNGSEVKFFKRTSDFSGSGVDGALSNFPPLLQDKKVVTGEKDSEVTAYQKVKALRGAVGAGDGHIYLVHASNATVEDMAYVMKSLGASDALNLDGGGTAALFVNGSYVVGPGRTLTNAIVLTKR